jgi:hypothetical protein
MTLTKVWFVLLLAGSLAVRSDATEEGVLVLSSFSLRADGLDDSGPVEVIGAYGGGSLTSLVVKAFGRDVALSKTQREEFRDFYVNSLQLSYTGGTDLGERTIYILLQRSFLSGTEAAKIIKVTGRGTVSVSERRSH